MEFNKDHIRTLLIEKAAGTISAEDDAFTERAIAQDGEVRDLWEEIQAHFGSAEGKSFLNSVDENEAWEKLKPGIASPSVIRRNSGRKKWLSVAAVLLAVSAVSVYYYLHNISSAGQGTYAATKPKILQLKLANGDIVNLQDKNGKIDEKGFTATASNKQLSYTGQTNTAAGWATLEVPAKLDYKMVLPDGTEVWLNSLSSLRFPYAFDGATREVYLEGEGYFHVAKNPDKPFIVHTKQTDVRVLGTIFNVNAYTEGKTITSLVEGSVLSTAGKQLQKLTPGLEAVYQNETFQTESFDASEVTAWMTGIHYFHETKLSALAPLLPRWFDVNMVIDDASAANITFSGAINKNKPLDVFLKNIEATAGIKSYFKDGELHFK